MDHRERQIKKSMLYAQAYGAAPTGPILPFPPEPVSPAKLLAFVAALEELWSQRWNSTVTRKGMGKRKRNLRYAAGFALRGDLDIAETYAGYAGLPQQQVKTIRTLIFD
jgi:hypothetical protein